MQPTVLRRCVACRKLIDRKQLLRVIRDHQDGVVLDIGMGRSAYICPNEDCLDEAHRRKRLQKDLRCQVPENIVKVLNQWVNHCNDLPAEAR